MPTLPDTQATSLLVVHGEEKFSDEKSVLYAFASARLAEKSA